MPRRVALLLTPIFCSFSTDVMATDTLGENVAQGVSYTIEPRPNYSHCTDPDDATQLTDGKTTSDYFWTQQGTVGWTRAQFVTVTLDLGQVQPIAGVSLTTAAGTAGVTWPMAIHVLVSDDGQTFHDAGDLAALDRKQRGPWPEDYAIRRLRTDDLRTRGRHVQFVIIPLPGGPYIFTDEIQVFRGEDALLDREPTGPIVQAKQVYQQGRIRRSIRHRIEHDALAIKQTIGSAKGLSPADRENLLEQIEQISRDFDSEAIPIDDSFRAVLPIGDVHARLFSIQADLWRRLGLPPLGAWVPPVWDPVDPFAVPPMAPGGAIEVHTMQGEYRASAINLANSTDRPLTVRLRLEGRIAPETVTVHDVQWTDTSQGIPVAAALPEAIRDGGGWRVTVPPGLVRQVWLTFHVTESKPGEHRGNLIAQAPGAAAVPIPVRLHVWPLAFPAATTLQVGGWSYTDGNARYGVTPKNRAAFLAHLRAHCVNSPWATSGVMMSFEFDESDPGKIHLDTETFDDWLQQWPQAKNYHVFLSVAHYSGTLKSSLGGVQIGTPEFDQRVATWISAWVRHLRSRGVAPHQLALLIHDEPHEGSDIEAMLAWARAIRKAEPEVVIWEDPTYRNPRSAPADLFEACDVLCPNRPMWLGQRASFSRFYRQQQTAGRELQFYSCSGPAKLLDPYSYYRLQAWHAWHVGGTGSFFWALGDNSGASSWNEYFAKSGPYTPLFLDTQSVTAGKHMEAIRESAEDYEYLAMLNRAVQRAKASGRSDSELQNAEALLNSASGRVLESAESESLRWHVAKDRTVADQLRVEILKALVSLRD